MSLLHIHHSLVPQTHLTNSSKKTFIKPQISCSSSSSNSINDMNLSKDLSIEIKKIKTQMAQSQEAMKTSRKLLYTEMCNYLGIGQEELKRKWEKMEEADKWVLAQEFVSDWGSNFHPLSAKSVKELVDQYVFRDDNDANKKVNDDDDGDGDSSFVLFSGLKKLMGFPDSI
uniref:uncharacterized protein LOC122593057 n=1 Tax=Erigeron canadensis TaxID=72917 RepID=UPI001CB8976D|nr:uncharacterized protein LOC122593057 [Erigeron canadensis]